MKIYRGPHSTVFSEHSLTDEKDFSSEVEPWTNEKVVKFNNTIIENAERQSVTHLEITENDILALYRNLQEGQIKELKSLRWEVKRLRGALKEIERKSLVKKMKAVDGFPSEINEIAKKVLGT